MSEKSPLELGPGNLPTRDGVTGYHGVLAMAGGGGGGGGTLLRDRHSLRPQGRSLR